MVRVPVYVVTMETTVRAADKENESAFWPIKIKQTQQHCGVPERVTGEEKSVHCIIPVLYIPAIRAMFFPRKLG